MKRLLALLVFSFSAFAQSTTPILVPVMFLGHGVGGSQWSTLVLANNFTTQTVDGRGVQFIIVCPIPEGCITGDLRPGDIAAVVGPFSPQGLLLHVPADEAERFEIQAQFGEFSHQRGVQLPIARERDFRTAPFAFVAVPLSGDIRSTLRIYGLEAGDVRVELLPAYFNGEPIDSRTVTLSAPDDIHPAFAQLNLQTDFAPIAQHYGAVRLRITPLGPRVWAFATVTQNITNDVTVITTQ